MCRIRTNIPTKKIVDLPKNIALANSVEKLKENYSEHLLSSSYKDTNQPQQFIFPSTQPQLLQSNPLLRPTYPLLPQTTIPSPSAPPPEDENEFNVSNRKEIPLQSPPIFTLEESEQVRYLASLAQKQYQEELDKQLAMNLQSEEDEMVQSSCSIKLYSLSFSLSNPLLIVL